MDLVEKLRDYLDALEIRYFVADKVEGSDYQGYLCVLIDTDDEDATDKLEELGFDRIKHDFYLITIDGFYELDEETIEQIKLNNSEKYKLDSKKDEFGKRLSVLRSLWGDIIEKYDDINSYFFRKHELNFFEPTRQTLSLCLRLPNILVRNERDLNAFCCGLYQLGRESVFEKTRSRILNIVHKKYSRLTEYANSLQYFEEELLNNDPFYTDIKILRNYYSHVRQREREEVKLEICYKRRGIQKLGNDFDFFQFQVKILKDFESFLAKIDDIIKTKL